MPGRYIDHLRRITREQGGLPDAPPSGGDGGERRPTWRRRYGPLFTLFLILALVGVGWLLMQRMMADSKLQDCVMSGRKNCAPIDGR